MTRFDLGMTEIYFPNLKVLHLITTSAPYTPLHQTSERTEGIRKNFEFVFRSLKSQKLREVVLVDEYMIGQVFWEHDRSTHSKGFKDFVDYHAKTLRILKTSLCPGIGMGTKSGPVELLNFEVLDIKNESGCEFWSSILETQKILQILTIDSSVGCWSWETLQSALLQSQSTLTSVCIQAKIIDGWIDFKIFQNTNLKHLHIEQLNKEMLQSRCVNIGDLPLSLKSLRLIRVHIHYTEQFHHLGKLPNLHTLCVTLRSLFNDNVFLFKVFGSDVRSILRNRTLNTLQLLGFGVRHLRNERFKRGLKELRGDYEYQELYEVTQYHDSTIII